MEHEIFALLSTIRTIPFAVEFTIICPSVRVPEISYTPAFVMVAVEPSIDIPLPSMLSPFKTILFAEELSYVESKSSSSK